MEPNHARSHKMSTRGQVERPRLSSRSGLLMAGLIAAFGLAAGGGAALGAAAAPKLQPRLNVYFQSDFKDATYQRAAFSKVLKSWAAPSSLPAAGKKTVVQSSIGRDGKLISTLVTMKSGASAWDEAALAAVRKAAPFAPLPAGYKGAQLEVHWHFETAP